MNTDSHKWKKIIKYEKINNTELKNQEIYSADGIIEYIQLLPILCTFLAVTDTNWKIVVC